MSSITVVSNSLRLYRKKNKIKNPHPKDVAFIRPPKRELPIGNIGFLISNAKAQMPNECQMTTRQTAGGQDA
jgi:hypothetical protein